MLKAAWRPDPYCSAQRIMFRSTRRERSARRVAAVRNTTSGRLLDEARNPPQKLHLSRRPPSVIAGKEVARISLGWAIAFRSGIAVLLIALRRADKIALRRRCRWGNPERRVLAAFRRYPGRPLRTALRWVECRRHGDQPKAVVLLIEVNLNAADAQILRNAVNALL